MFDTAAKAYEGPQKGGPSIGSPFTGAAQPYGWTPPAQIQADNDDTPNPFGNNDNQIANLEALLEQNPAQAVQKAAQILQSGRYKGAQFEQIKQLADDGIAQLPNNEQRIWQKHFENLADLQHSANLKAQKAAVNPSGEGEETSSVIGSDYVRQLQNDFGRMSHGPAKDNVDKLALIAQSNDYLPSIAEEQEEPTHNLVNAGSIEVAATAPVLAITPF